jgi:transcriptional regulator with XRE-family HTH domain
MSRTPESVTAGAPLETIAASLRRERTRLGVSLGELARRAGLAKSTLSQLEAGTGNPSVETLWALAVTLDVPFSRLVEPTARPMRVVRAGEAAGVMSERSTFSSALLAACPPGARRDLHVITAEPGPAREAQPHLPGTVEHMLITSGRWTVGPVADQVEVTAGDYACFAADQPHRYAALVPGSAALLVMEYS